MRISTIALAVVSALVATTHASSQDSGAVTQCAALVEQNKLAEAEPICTQAAAESPHEGRLVHGDFLFRKGDVKGAIQRYTELLEGADRSKPTEVQLAALNHRAHVAFMSGGGDVSDDVLVYLRHRPNDLEMLRLGAQATPWHDQRQDYANRLIALKPDELEFHLMRVDAFIRGGRGKDAVTAAEAAMKLDASQNFAQTWRGFAYSAAGDHARAERDHAAVARRLPKEPDPRANQAEALLGLQRYSEAIDAASEALALRADHLSALRVRARARLNMGDGEGALADIQAAKRAAPGTFDSDIEEAAPDVIEAQKAMTRESIARMESDRKVIVEAVAAHLHGKCGNYRLPDYEDNANLNAYRDCILAWSKARDQSIAQEFHHSVLETAERFYSSAGRMELANGLRCSRMPKKSRCVEDSMYARAEAAHAGMDNPQVLVGQAEWDRLQQEVIAYNARLGRQQALAKTASFLDALANALSAQ